MFPSARGPLSRHTRQHTTINATGAKWTGLIKQRPNTYSGIPVGSAGGSLQRFVAPSIRSVPGRLGERHGLVCTEILNLLQPATDCVVAPIFLRSATTTITTATACTSSSYGWEKKNYKNTWRCPDRSADYPAGYWLRAPVCHRRPKQSRAPSAPGLWWEQRQERAAGWRSMGRGAWGEDVCGLGVWGWSGGPTTSPFSLL